jgi:hypothetical protein
MDARDLTISGKLFQFVKRSRRGNVSIYKFGELFARVGEQNVIEPMIALHKKFVQFGFPVPEIVEQGEVDGKKYFLEKSLGEKFFSFLFADDIKKYGVISPELFEKFISITGKFAWAQFQTKVSSHKGLSITDLIGPKDLAEELPEFGGRIMKLYGEALGKIKTLPLVLTHGDFCSHNLFPAGIIDFEKAYFAPVGYDIVTNIFQNKYFPASREYEYFQYYVVSEEQENLYYERLDALYREAGLPEISKYKEPFEFCRAVWHTARNSKSPKLQKWRYEFFKKQYLN